MYTATSIGGICIRKVLAYTLPLLAVAIMHMVDCSHLTISAFNASSINLFKTKNTSFS